MTKIIEIPSIAAIEENEELELEIFENWLAENPGSSKEASVCNGGFVPWFRQVQSYHQQLRRFLAGISKKTIVQNEAAETPLKADNPRFIEAIDELQKAFDYTNYKLRGDHRLMNALASKYYCPDGVTSHIRRKTIGLIQAVFQEQVIGNYGPKTIERAKSCGGNYLELYKRLEKGASLLGDAWAANVTTSAKIEVEISTAASAFYNLGYYNVDLSSCFRQGGLNGHHKFLVGQSKNSFVIIMKKDSSICARCWGFVEFAKDNEINAIHIFNPYLAPDMLYGDFISSLEKFFQVLVPNKTPQFIDNYARAEFAYNNENRMSYLFGPKTEESKIIRENPIEFKTGKQFTCENCRGTSLDIYGYYRFSGKLICRKCFCSNTFINSYRGNIRSLGKSHSAVISSVIGRETYVTCSTEDLVDFKYSEVHGIYVHKDIPVTDVIYQLNPKLIGIMISRYLNDYAVRSLESGQYILKTLLTSRN